MKAVVIFLFLVGASQAQPTNLKVVATTPTRAVIEYHAPSDSACTVEVSEESDYSPVVNDVNATLFASANSDTRWSSEHQGRVRRIIVGTGTVEAGSDGKLYSRALRAYTRHYARVICGSAAAVEFTTAAISGVPLQTSNFLSGAHGNWGAPDFDWSDRSKPVIDPQTGAAIYRITDPSEAGFQQNQNFVAQFDGSGWTNASNLISGVVGTLATTSNTNTAFGAVDLTTSTIEAGFAANEGWPRLSALAVRVFGSGTDATASNRQVTLCLSIDSGQSCYTSNLTVTLPQTTAAEVGLYPAEFPTANFTGWSKPIPSEYWTNRGYVTVSGNTVTLTKNRSNEAIANQSTKQGGSYFRHEWVAGTRIYIAGSSPTCASNYCTIASVQSKTSLTISESVTIGSDAAYKIAALGVRIAKTNTTGSVSISVASRVAAYLAHHSGAAEMCSRLSVSTTVDRAGSALGRTITGRLCVINRARDTIGRLYFVGESEPEFRLLSMNAAPSSISGHTANEHPSGPGFFPSGQAIWSTTNANRYYVRTQTVGGSPSVFELTYSGDYRENSSALWSYSAIGSVSATDPVTWNNLFKGSLDPRTQILANTAYNETLWPSLTNLQFSGFVEGYFIFYNLLSGQDLPCALFAFASDGVFARWTDTLGNGTGGLKFAGCHSIQPYATRVFVSTHKLNSASTGVKFGGPFVAPVTHLYRGGSPSTNTALPTLYDGTYDGACPTDISQAYKDLGATGNECVKIRISGQPCSSTPHSAELAASVCPWDAAKSYIGANVVEGDSLQDYQKSYNPGNDSDSERFMVVKVTDVGGGVKDLDLLRDSATGYACQIANPRGRECVAISSQSTHTTGWNAMFEPISAVPVWDPATGTVENENESITGRHFDIVSLGSGLHTYVGAGTSSYGGRVNQSSYGTAPYKLFSYSPAFGGSSVSTTYTQSYIAAPTAAATGDATAVGGDFRHINSPFGNDWEVNGQTVGDAITYTLEGGTTSIYKLSTLSTDIADYKRNRIVGWAGFYVLDEKSGPSVTLTDSDTWKFCYALASNECRTGSSAGDVYAVIPGLDTSGTQCHVSQMAYRSSCLFGISGIQSNILQTRIDRTDRDGIFQRSIGTSLIRPGSQYVYTKARMFGNSTKMLSTAYHWNGWYVGAIMVDPGPWNLDTQTTHSFRPIPVKIPSGVITTRAVIRFWYDEHNGYCTARQEACYATAAALVDATPFAWASEVGSSTGVSCSSGCAVEIPSMPGRLVRYQIYDNVSGVLTAVGSAQIR